MVGVFVRPEEVQLAADIDGFDDLVEARCLNAVQAYRFRERRPPEMLERKP